MAFVWLRIKQRRDVVLFLGSPCLILACSRRQLDCLCGPRSSWKEAVLRRRTEKWLLRPGSFAVDEKKARTHEAACVPVGITWRVVRWTSSLRGQIKKKMFQTIARPTGHEAASLQGLTRNAPSSLSSHKNKCPETSVHFSTYFNLRTTVLPDECVGARFR